MKNKTSHHEEHQNWSRRQFLTTGGLASFGSLLLGATPVSAYTPNKLMAALNTANTDRVLVLIYQFGGNDGLNTIIPYSMEVGVDKYKEYRPTISQKHGVDYQDNMLLTGHGATNHALHAVMEPLMNAWHNDQMHIVHNVGYSKSSFSHFIGRDIWFSGAAGTTDAQFSSGWMGRYLEQLYPSFLDAPPTTPPALKIGSSGSKIFTNNQGNNMELVFANPAEFHRIVTTGTRTFYDTEGLGDCPSDVELGFIRQTANSSLHYADITFEAYENSADKPTVNYTQNDLSDQLKIVARLIKGGLGTKIYMVRQSGFDTHSNQLIAQRKGLEDLATAVTEFFQDLSASGDEERVIAFPFSEFGRTTRDNGSGTDHGNMSDLMLFGKGVNSGFSGTPFNLREASLIDGASRSIFDAQEGATDYRSIYATLLQDWLCIDSLVVDYAMGERFQRLPNLIANPCTTNREETPEILLGHGISGDNLDIPEIRYGVLQPGIVKIEVLNQEGQQLVTLVNEHHSPGTYNFQLPAQQFPFPPGSYFYKMHTGGKEYVRKMKF